MGKIVYNLMVALASLVLAGCVAAPPRYIYVETPAAAPARSASAPSGTASAPSRTTTVVGPRGHACDRPNWAEGEEWVAEARKGSRLYAEREFRAEKATDPYDWYWDPKGKCWYRSYNRAVYEGVK